MVLYVKIFNYLQTTLRTWIEIGSDMVGNVHEMFHTQFRIRIFIRLVINNYSRTMDLHTWLTLSQINLQTFFYELYYELYYIKSSMNNKYSSNIFKQHRFMMMPIILGIVQNISYSAIQIIRIYKFGRNVFTFNTLAKNILKTEFFASLTKIEKSD